MSKATRMRSLWAQARTKGAAAPKGSLLEAMSVVCTTIADEMAKKIASDFKSEFGSLKKDKASDSQSHQGGTVLIDFEVEKDRVRQWGFDPKGWISVSCGFRAGDVNPTLSVSVQYNNTQTNTEFPVKWTDTPANVLRQYPRVRDLILDHFVKASR